MKMNFKVPSLVLLVSLFSSSAIGMQIFNCQVRDMSKLEIQQGDLSERLVNATTFDQDVKSWNVLAIDSKGNVQVFKDQFEVSWLDKRRYNLYEVENVGGSVGIRDLHRRIRVRSQGFGFGDDWSVSPNATQSVSLYDDDTNLSLRCSTRNY